MKTILLKTLMLIAAVAACNMFAFAQIGTKPKQIREGKWELIQESVHAVKSGCNHDSSEAHADSHEAADVRMEDINIEIFTELQVKQDSIILISSQSRVGAKYVYNDRNGLTFDTQAVPFNPGGGVFGTKIFVQQKVDDPLDKVHPIYVSFVYEYKK